MQESGYTPCPSQRPLLHSVSICSAFFLLYQINRAPLSEFTSHTVLLSVVCFTSSALQRFCIVPSFLYVHARAHILSCSVPRSMPCPDRAWCVGTSTYSVLQTSNYRYVHCSPAPLPSLLTLATALTHCSLTLRPLSLLTRCTAQFRGE